MTATIKRCSAHRWYVKGCDDCREHARLYADRVDRLKAYGRWTGGYVDAAPVQAHLAALRSGGYTWRDLAELLGMTKPTDAWALTRRKRMHAETARKVHAIPVPPDSTDFMPIDVRIREVSSLREAVELGRAACWTDAEIADARGVDIRSVVRVASQYGIRSGTGRGWNQTDRAARGAA